MLCVLVVDDDAGLCEMAARLLELAGYATASAGSGGEAIAIARARSDVDAALIDISLPDMTGFDLARELRGLDRPLRIAFMTGYTPDDFKFPADATIVTKPFTLEELTRAMGQALARPPSE